MSLIAGDIIKLKEALEKLTAEFETLQMQQAETTAAFILALKLLGGKFIIDQTDIDTEQLVNRIMAGEIGFKINVIMPGKIFEFELSDSESAQELDVPEKVLNVE